MGFSWNNIGNEILGGLEDTGTQIGNALNPIGTIGQLGNDANNIVGSTTSLGNNIVSTTGSVVNNGIGAITSLTNMLPYILVGGVVLFVLSKS